MHDGSAGLVVGEDQRVGDDDVFPSGSGEHHDLRDVVGRQRLATPGSKRISTEIINASSSDTEEERNVPVESGE